MKKFLKIFFIFVSLFILLNTNSQQLSNKISNFHVLNHFISQNDNHTEKISLKLNTNENYIVKSNSFSETIVASRKQNELGLNLSKDFTAKNSNIITYTKIKYKKILYFNPYNTLFRLRNDICTRAP